VVLTTSASDTEGLQDAIPIWNGSPKSVGGMLLTPFVFVIYRLAF
jgi:hypothetical protein